MNVLDLFSGIGAFSLGLERAGMTTVAFCEKEKFCQRVLKKHWPEIPIYDDVRELTSKRLRADGIAVDVICGGFPCQPVSVAGKQQGAADERWLWPEFRRIIREIRPRYVIIENVINLLSGRSIEQLPNDRCLCGWPYRWRGLHQHSGRNKARDLSTTNRCRNDGQSDAGFGSTQESFWRRDQQNETPFGQMGGSSRLESFRKADGNLFGSSASPFDPEETASRTGSSPISDGCFTAKATERTRTLVRPGAQRRKDSKSSDAGTKSQGAATYRDDWLVCEACGRDLDHAATRSVNSSWMGGILWDFASLGYVCEWSAIRACDFGAPHIRDRIWIVAYPQCGDIRDEPGRWRRTGRSDQAEPGDDGAARLVADANGRRCEGERIAQHGDQQGASGRELIGLRSPGRRNGEATADTGLQRLPLGPRIFTRQQAADTAASTHIWWPAQPGVCRGDVCIANRVERIKALGNTLLPAIPEMIGREIMRVEGRC